MSCKKTNEEIEKQIQTEQEFADLRFRNMRSERYGLSPCCSLDKLEKITSKKELCDWDDKKLPVYLDKGYTDHTDTGYESYKWLFENATIPDWVRKVCRPCTPLSSTVITTTKTQIIKFSDAVIDADSYLVREKTKIYMLAKYDGTISANQTTTFLTVGYGEVPAAVPGDSFKITTYGNTNAADPKNGADEDEVLTIIIDKNGDGSELYQVKPTTISAWNPNIFVDGSTINLTNFGTKTEWCKYDISLDCTFCGEGRRQDPDMYFFYDVTSLGVVEVKDTHEIVEQWLNALRTIGAFNGRVYHTSIYGERWLDWAIMPYTGAFNNGGFCGGTFSAGLGTPGVIGPQNPTWAGGTGGAVDAAQPPASNSHYKYWGVLDYMINTKDIEWYDNGDGVTTATYSGSEVTPSGLPVKSQGPPPINQSKELLVVIFADEAASPGVYNQPYHVDNASTTPTWIYASGGADSTTAEPTPCWIADYDKFVIEHNKFLAQGSDYKANYFIYPAYPKTVQNAHKAFPLHVIGAITSGDNPVGSGILTSAPSNGISTLTAATTGTNPYVAAGKGKLDQYNWGYNVDQLATGFVKDDFVTNLEAFWNPGDEECINDAECISIYVKDDQGNPIECYPIYIDNREVGMTDKDGFYLHTEYFASTNTKHSIDVCHCFTTTGGCDQQRIDITLTPEETKVACTKLTVDCTPET